MGKFYGIKIKDGDINLKTGEAWKIEDVPHLWRHATEVWLNENS